MSQADSPNTTSPSRRTVLAGISVAVAPVAVAVDKSLGAAAADPIFALLEAYDRTASHEFALYRENDKLKDALPEEQTTWAIHFGGDGEGRRPPEGCDDAPDWINMQLTLSEVSDKRSDLMLALLTTAPTTIGGTIALLERLDASPFPEEDVLDGVESLIATMGNWYDQRVMDAADVFHSALAAALRGIATAQA